MLKIRLGLFLTVIAPLSIAGNQWNMPLSGGQMRFQGELIAESCTVETGDRQLIVRMGQVSSNRFKSVGDTADPVPFTIHLQDCNAHVSSHVDIMFHGVADGKNPDILSVGEGGGTALGIGIALFDGNGHFVPINSVFNRNSETQYLQLIAKYRATGHMITGGAANAQAWFSLIYQ
ncbi:MULTISPECIES: fimbrial protein [unclassified Serratia (in: enterobacteria)]|uniref:fimbrial protein n=1 Tax=unclassified Serratia (in: enterobacteria) TaxID=2647522 RepID=UPI0027F4EC50|nr:MULTISPECIES: fimbrial protein [unclassified Serratia (in: enterobacteria)]MDQ7099074.1 fimbrial protein [Serratia sp. MF2]MDQ7105580.1 fimbrial protein [Serratia sp. MF1(2023)]